MTQQQETATPVDESAAPRPGNFARLNNPSTLKGRAYHSAAWMAVGFGASSVIRLLNSMILTRILFPQVFGMMALIQTIIRGFELFTDVGAGYSIVREKQGADPNFLNTAWTIQVARGFGIWALIAIAAWPLAIVYRKPELGLLLAAAGMEVAISGFNSTSLSIFRRNLEQHKTVRLQIATQIVAVITAVTLAYFLRSVWAIIFSQWITSSFNAIRSHAINPGPPNRLHWDPKVARTIFRFGRWVFVSTILTYLSMQMDRLMLGRMIPLALFGAYAIANNIVDIPRTLVGRLNDLVLFPAVSRRADLPRAELRAKLEKNRWYPLIAMACGIALIAGTGDLLMRVLYDARFAAAAWILPVLILGIWPRAINLTSGGALVALGHMQYSTFGGLGRLIFVGTALPLAFRHFGLPGVVIVVACSEIPAFLVNQVGRRQHGLRTSRQDFLMTALMVGVFGAIVGVRVLLGVGTPFDRIPWQ
jgi:O-antigen/teichoic acid export membrane protein